MGKYEKFKKVLSNEIQNAKKHVDRDLYYAKDELRQAKQRSDQRKVKINRLKKVLNKRII